MTSLETDTNKRIRKGSHKRPRVVLPEPGLSLKQDTEWCLVCTDDGWHEIRFHDYADVYAVPGLYEHLFHNILECDSPATIRSLLVDEVQKSSVSPETLRVLDLGAGNGIVGEELAGVGVETIIGVDILEAARRAVERDRPEIYSDYLVTDIASPSEGERKRLQRYGFNCLTCVAALGFGDIPVHAFAAAYDLIERGGWVAFNINENFLNGRDSTGFARLIHKMIASGTLCVRVHKRYRHRLATNGDPIFYEALIGTKTCDFGVSA